MDKQDWNKIAGERGRKTKIDQANGLFRKSIKSQIMVLNQMRKYVAII